MAEADVRVALLARAGTARDQLHRALSDAGATIVAEGDPAELDPADVQSKSPTVYLVSLEPSIEPALDRFETQFAAPGVEVMFDEAEVTGKLDGWDLNRWARHVASKLTGSEGLPPAPEGSQINADEVQVAPGLPPTPAELMDHAKLEDYTADSPELANWVPSSPSLTPTADAPDAAPADDRVWAVSTSTAQQEESQFSLDTDLGLDLDLSGLDLAPEHTPEPSPASEGHGLEEPILGDLNLGEKVRFSNFGDDEIESGLGDIDADVAQLAAQLEAFEKTDQRQTAVDPSFTTTHTAEPVVGKRPPSPKDARNSDARLASSDAKPAPSINFDDLELTSEEAPIAKPEPGITPKFVSSLDSLELSLTSIDGHEGLGAVLILAGLGGPDAVRQLLSSLPESLRVPVLLYQHLEVGKHERLVEQLAKISKLPVVLAKEGGTPESGKVTLLPAGMTAIAAGESLSFTPGTLSQLITALPPHESMIIVLSGAEVGLVPMILSVKDAGGHVLAQDPEVCFDAAAADAMRKEGAAVYPAIGLARQIAARWPV